MLPALPDADTGREGPGLAVGQAQAKVTTDGLQAHSLRALINDLASVVVNVVRLPGAGRERTTIVTQRTRLQTRAFEPLEVNRDRTVPISMTG